MEMQETGHSQQGGERHTPCSGVEKIVTEQIMLHRICFFTKFLILRQKFGGVIFF